MPAGLREYVIEKDMVGGREGIRTPDPLLANKVGVKH